MFLMQNIVRSDQKETLLAAIKTSHLSYKNREGVSIGNNTIFDLKNSNYENIY